MYLTRETLFNLIMKVGAKVNNIDALIINPEINKIILPIKKAIKKTFKYSKLKMLLIKIMIWDNLLLKILILNQLI
jgi:hypothetical protein